MPRPNVVLYNNTYYLISLRICAVPRVLTHQPIKSISGDLKAIKVQSTSIISGSTRMKEINHTLPHNRLSRPQREVSDEGTRPDLPAPHREHCHLRVVTLGHLCYNLLGRDSIFNERLFTHAQGDSSPQLVRLLQHSPRHDRSCEFSPWGIDYRMSRSSPLAFGGFQIWNLLGHATHPVHDYGNRWLADALWLAEGGSLPLVIVQVSRLLILNNIRLLMFVTPAFLGLVLTSNHLLEFR
jgi:hypothetical protein